MGTLACCAVLCIMTLLVSAVCSYRSWLCVTEDVTFIMEALRSDLQQLDCS